MMDIMELRTLKGLKELPLLGTQTIPEDKGRFISTNLTKLPLSTTMTSLHNLVSCRMTIRLNTRKLHLQESVYNLRSLRFWTILKQKRSSPSTTQLTI